jgi:hypothetical protein
LTDCLIKSKKMIKWITLIFLPKHTLIYQNVSPILLFRAILGTHHMDRNRTPLLLRSALLPAHIHVTVIDSLITQTTSPDLLSSSLSSFSRNSWQPRPNSNCVRLNTKLLLLHTAQFEVMWTALWSAMFRLLSNVLYVRNMFLVLKKTRESVRKRGPDTWLSRPNSPL